MSMKGDVCVYIYVNAVNTDALPVRCIKVSYNKNTGEMKLLEHLLVP